MKFIWIFFKKGIDKSKIWGILLDIKENMLFEPQAKVLWTLSEVPFLQLSYVILTMADHQYLHERSNFYDEKYS